MKRIWIGLVIFVCTAVSIGMASVSYAHRHNYDSICFLGGIGRVELRDVREFTAEDIQNIEIIYSNKNIILLKSNTDKIVIKEYLHKSRKGDSRIEKEGNTLHIKEEEGVHMIYLFGFPMGMERIEVYLPEAYGENIDIASTSGNIKVDSNWNFNQFRALATSGNISCKEVSAQELEATTSSGNISFHKAEGRRKITTNSGNITLKDGVGDTDVKATSGNIMIKGASGSLRASARSGNINAEFEHLGSKVQVDTTSGNIKLEIPKDSDFSYKASASSGIINTSFDKYLSYNKKGNNASGVYGQNAKTEIETTATSGLTSVKLE